MFRPRLLPLVTFLSIPLSAGAAPPGVDFNESIRPLFNAHCVGCHGGVKKAGGLSFLARDEAIAEGKSGLPAIVPGDSAKSHMLERILSDDLDERMPPPEHGAALSAAEVDVLRQWIEEGAEWKRHWAFEPQEKIAPPEVTQKAWCQTPIDHFILRTLESMDWHPSAPADKATLLRRASFDLTGLPPTTEQLDRFLADESREAFATMVDELLESHAFGERWAAMWLDLARYADSEGLGVDARRETWAYRDWVVRAFAENKPFDQFVIDQLAGDLLPEPSIDQLVATAFHRQTQSNGEGGTDDEEFRVAAVMDRTNTTWEVFQGISFGCVQCHSHPYDPIKHDEYYEFLSFFNNTADADLGNHWPTLRVPRDRALYQEAQALREETRRLRESLTRETKKQLEATAWHTPTVADVKATSAGNGVAMTAHDGLTEFRSVGNIAAGTEYFFQVRGLESLEALTAIRIDLMPVDEEQARHTPEWSGILSRIQLEVWHEGDEEYQSVPLAQVYGDEAEPTYDPNDSLKRGSGGFGAMSKIFHRRTCVVVPEQPIRLREGSMVMLSLKHEIQALGAFPLVTQRGAIHFTGDDRWTAFYQSDQWSTARDRIAEVRSAARKIPASSVPIMRERPAHLQRESRMFERGNWLEKGKVVTPGVPGFLPPLPPSQKTPDRLALAKWMVSPDNPLTARVAVNRFWEQLFGYGLVATLEDFGGAGEKPSHPELLDWLAVHFREDLQWDVKALLRLMVLSATYQQSAKAPPEAHERDLQNRWLARGPRRRLKAEMIRDFALATSGLLNPKSYGPPVRPPLPKGVWKPFARDPWETEEDAERYRRAIYVYWKRSIPFPSLVTFDAPSRELCNQRRLPSNTPLQALVTLNDPVFVESANALADRMQKHANTLDEQLRHGHRLATSHEPSAERLTEMLNLYDQLVKTYQKDQPEGIDDFEDASLKAVASVLLNLDESLTK